MDKGTDLTSTLGWRISQHAKGAAARRGVQVDQILAVIASPEVTYPHRCRQILVRGRLAVVTVREAQLVVTVLLTGREHWDDDVARQILAS